MTLLLALLLSASLQACFRSDVAAMCCASACEVKARRAWADSADNREFAVWLSKRITELGGKP